MMLLYLIFLFSPGVTAHQFLGLGFGARAIAMAGTYTGVSDDVYAIFYNPAGLRSGKEFDIALTSSAFPLDASLASGAVKYYLKGIGTLAGGFAFFSTSDILWDEYGTKIDEFGISDLGVLLSYAFKTKKNLMIGVTGKGIYSRLGDYSISSFGFDAGVLYNLFDVIYLGVSLKNVGIGARFYKERDPAPVSLSCGTSIRFSIKNIIRFLLALDTKAGLGCTPSYTVGGEIKIHFPEKNTSKEYISGLALRAGYDPGHYFRGEYEPGGSSLTTGIGIECAIPKTSFLMVFDVIYRDYGYFGQAEHLSLSFVKR